MKSKMLFATAALAAALTTAPVMAAHDAAADPVCTDGQLLIARGTNFNGPLVSMTSEDTADEVIAPLIPALEHRTPDSTWSVYNVRYSADFFGFRSVGIGNRDLVEQLRTQAAACPNQVFVLAGYSQGANVIGNAIGMDSSTALIGGPVTATISPDVEPRVKAVLFFASPLQGQGAAIPAAYRSRSLEFCQDRDPVCLPGGLLATPPAVDYAAHTNYTEFFGPAAEFVAERL